MLLTKYETYFISFLCALNISIFIIWSKFFSALEERDIDPDFTYDEGNNDGEIYSLDDVVSDSGDPTEVKQYLTEPETEHSLALKSLINKMKQEDYEVVDYIRMNFVHPSPHKELQLVDSHEADPSQYGEGKIFSQIFDNKVEGRYLEAGAFDGEVNSKTIYLERFFNWTGVLVEVDPRLFSGILTKNRKASSINACLSPKRSPTILKYRLRFRSAKKEPTPTYKDKIVEFQCLPLYSIMEATSTTTLDLLSLNVGGNGFKVLRTIPWPKVDIRVVNLRLLNTFQENEELIKEYMSFHGYHFLQVIVDNFVFIKTDIY